jgi:hypothetical protein
MGNAGTAIRPLTAALALSGGHYRLSGVARMHERPIGDLVDGCARSAQNIRYAGNEGFPPLEIHPAQVELSNPIRLRGDVSSQFLTALLMALPLTGRRAVIEMSTELISKPYVEITLNLMARFGVTVERDAWQRFTIEAGQSVPQPRRAACRRRCLGGFVFSCRRRHRRGGGARGGRGARPASRATSSLPMRWRRWGHTSSGAITISKRAARRPAGSRPSTSTSTTSPMRR